MRSTSRAVSGSRAMSRARSSSCGRRSRVSPAAMGVSIRQAGVGAPAACLSGRDLRGHHICVAGEPAPFTAPFRTQMSPATLPLQRYLDALHDKHQALDEGTVAAYIPQLAKADPDWFGICIVTTDGYAYAVGEADRQFTLQSISKPAVYAAALADRGREAVLRKVGVEPSGEAFNSISLDPQTGAPFNPMINAGAIATTGLVAGTTAEEQWGRIANIMSGFFGIAIFSPRLDENGNSARGIAVCREISREFGLHVFGMSVSPSLVLSRVFSALDLPSRRVRSMELAIRLRKVASRIKCYCLQGEVAFDGAEFIVRQLIQVAPGADSFILDMHRVSYLAESAARLLLEVRQLLVAQGKALVFSRIRGRAVVEDALRHALPEGDGGYLSFEDNDLAVEWCEDRLLDSATESSPPVSTVAAFPLFAGMPEPTLARLQD